MKKITLALSALALLLGMSACKKNAVSPAGGDMNTCNITVNTGGGAKADIDFTTGATTFAYGDVLYVAYDGKYIGAIEHDGTNFSGTVATPTTGAGKLYFYFLGNVKPAETPTSGITSSCSVVISDQASSLPVISFGASNEDFTGEGTYSANLAHKCALVKFDVTKAANGYDYNMGVCVTGLQNKVTVDFTQATAADNGFSYGTQGNGDITFVKRGSDGYWAILLPNASGQAAGADGTAFSGHFKGSRPALPALEAGRKYGAGYAVNVTTEYAPEGAINALFSVSANKKVMFSKGNLKATTTDAWRTWTWSFMENQYDKVESYISVNNNYYGLTEVGLFGWGTSGYNHNGNIYQPWSTHTNYAAYYAYNCLSCDFHGNGENGTADWGYNNISNGGDGYKQWRTLTAEEWQYLFDRVVNGKPGFTYNTVSGIDGVVIYPDNYTGADCNGGNWTECENAGCVFLPRNGYRSDTSVHSYDNSSGYPQGYYWSSTGSSDYGRAYNVRIYSETGFMGSTTNKLKLDDSSWRNWGLSVRLVR